jgi:hypothetical protein
MASERRMRRAVPEFKLATEQASHGWHHIDLTDLFPKWLAADRKREAFFQQPSNVNEERFSAWLKTQVVEHMAKAGPEDVVAVTGAGTLFGVHSLSSLIKAVEGSVQGRMLVFFPGSREGNLYKFFETGDGWNYLAVPIVARPETC